MPLPFGSLKVAGKPNEGLSESPSLRVKEAHPSRENGTARKITPRFRTTAREGIFFTPILPRSLGAVPFVFRAAVPFVFWGRSSVCFLGPRPQKEDFVVRVAVGAVSPKKRISLFAW